MKTKQLIAILVMSLMLSLPLAQAFTITHLSSDVTLQGNSAVINWTTSVDADSKISYWNPNTAELEEINSELVKNHSMELNGLSEKTKYYYTLTSKDENNTIASKTELAFITLDITPPPKVMNLVINEFTEDTVSLQWESVNRMDFENYLIYRDGVNIVNQTQLVYTNEGLDAGMPYEYKVRAIDESGNLGEFSDVVAVYTIGEDQDAPIITNFSITGVSDNSASFFWNTNEDSDSKVLFGLGEFNLEEYRVDLVKEHTLTISGLTKDTLYYYKIVSCDAKDNCIEGEAGEFIAGSDMEPPGIDVEIPSSYNSIGLDFDVYTEGLAEIRIYVNDLYSRKMNADESGFVHFEDIVLSSSLATNFLKIVAEDFAGNSAEKIFPISMDFEDPEFVIQTNISEVISQGTFSVQGYVDEVSKIEFFIDLEPFDKTPPSKVENLVMGELGEGFVNLVWDGVPDNDLFYYMIFKEGEGLIGISDSNGYTDETIDPGMNYNYWVSAMDKDCFEGESSDAFNVQTMAGDYAKTLMGNSSEIMHDCLLNEPVVVLDGISGSFSQPLTLGQGINNLKIIATDLAGNFVEYNYQAIYDTQIPLFEETNLGSLDPTYNQQVTIYGKLSEPATVFVYLNGDNESVKSVESDNNGSFSVDVKLRKEVEIMDGQSWDNQVLLKAVDVAGLEGQTSGSIVYSLCGGGMKLFSVTTKNIFPNELTPRLLLEGMEQVTLELDFEWMGSDKEPLVDVDVNFLGLNIEQEENYDNEYISEPGVYVISKDPGYQGVSVVLEINKLPDPTPDGENWTLYDKEKNISKFHNGHCFGNVDAMSDGLGGLGNIDGLGCIKIPLEIILTYPHEYQEHSPEPQKECLFVDVVIQPPYSISDKYNKKMLEGMVDFLGGMIDIVDAALKPIETIHKWLFGGCLLATALRVVKQFSEFISCRSLIITGGDSLDACKSCTIGSEGVTCGSDAADDCKPCLDAKLLTLKFERAMSMICRRVNCKPIPSFETYAENQDSYTFLGKESSCSGFGDNEEGEGFGYTTELLGYSKEAGTTGGLALNNVESDICNILPSANVCTEGDAEGGGNKELCVQQYVRDWDSAALFMNEFKESICLAPDSIVSEGVKEEAGCGGLGNIFRGVRDFSICKDNQNQDHIEYQYNGDNIIYLVRVEKDGYTPEGNEGGDEGDKADIWGMAYKYKSFGEGLVIEGTCEDVEDGVGVCSDGGCTCTTVGSCNCEVSGNFKYAGPMVAIAKQNIIASEGVTGYVVDNGKMKDKIKSLTDTNMLDFPQGEGVEIVSYIMSKCEKITNNEIPFNSEQWPKFDTPTALNPFNVLEIKEVSVPQPIVNFICDGYQPQETHILDPSKGFFKSLQAVCIPTIRSYLSRTKGILQAMRGCFNHILVVGEGSAGYCQQFFSTYICDLIYYTISCVSKMVPDSGSSGSAEFGEGIGGWGQYLMYSMQETQRGVETMYGVESSLSSLLSGKQVFNSVCLVMFGADVPLNLDSLMDMSGADTPIEPFVLISGATRRFNSINFATGYVTHVYTIPAMAVTEQEITYSISLICSDDYSCDPSEGFENGQCDCVEQGEKKKTISGAMNERLEEGGTLNMEFLERVGDSKDNAYRYDTVEFEYRYMVGPGGLIGQRGTLVTDTVRAPIRAVGGQAPAYCFYSNGEFKCSVSADERADARFIDPRASNEKIPARGTFYLGEDIISEVAGTQFTFDVEQFEVNDYDKEMPIYIKYVLENKGNTENPEVYAETKKLTRLGFYGEEGGNYLGQFDLEKHFYNGGESENEYSCFGGWCAVADGNSRLLGGFNLTKLTISNADRTTPLYLIWDGNQWELNEHDAMSDVSIDEDCELSSGEWVCKGYTDSSDNPVEGNSQPRRGFTYEVSFKIPAGNDPRNGESIKLEKRDEYTNCESSPEHFDLTIGLYNSKPSGMNEEIDEIRPIIYDGEEQEITYRLKAKCIERSEEEARAETDAEVAARGSETTNGDVGESDFESIKECPNNADLNNSVPCYCGNVFNDISNKFDMCVDGKIESFQFFQYLEGLISSYDDWFEEIFNEFSSSNGLDTPKTYGNNYLDDGELCDEWSMSNLTIVLHNLNVEGYEIKLSDSGSKIILDGSDFFEDRQGNYIYSSCKDNVLTFGLRGDKHTIYMMHNYYRHEEGDYTKIYSEMELPLLEIIPLSNEIYKVKFRNDMVFFYGPEIISYTYNFDIRMNKPYSLINLGLSTQGYESEDIHISVDIVNPTDVPGDYTPPSSGGSYFNPTDLNQQ